MIHFPEEYIQKLIGGLNSKTDLLLLVLMFLPQ